MIGQNKLKIILPAVVVAAFGVAIITTFLSQPSNTPPPLPNPNGYDDFANAALISTGGILNISKATKAELSQFVTTNREALKLVRVGLTKESLFPIANLQNRTKEFTGINRLGSLLAAEGQLAELKGKNQ